MARQGTNKQMLKLALKEALGEALRDHRELLHEIFTEVLEDFALAEAIREGRRTPPAKRAEVVGLLSKHA
jgi:hypothetical protein